MGGFGVGGSLRVTGEAKKQVPCKQAGGRHTISDIAGRRQEAVRVGRSGQSEKRNDQ